MSSCIRGRVSSCIRERGVLVYKREGVLLYSREGSPPVLEGGLTSCIRVRNM